MAKCPWSGKIFQNVRRGANEKVFADDAARAEAHKAARLYAIAMIDQGLLSWEQVRRWYQGRSDSGISSYTTAAGGESATDGGK